MIFLYIKAEIFSLNLIIEKVEAAFVPPQLNQIN